MFRITRKYIATPRRGSYVLRRRDTAAMTAGAISAAGGLCAIFYGLWRRDRLGLVISVLGGATALGAAARLELLSLPIRAMRTQANGGPSYARDLESTASQQRPTDDVEEALMASFPASDPPPHSGDS